MSATTQRNLRDACSKETLWALFTPDFPKPSLSQNPFEVESIVLRVWEMLLCVNNSLALICLGWLFSSWKIILNKILNYPENWRQAVVCQLEREDSKSLYCSGLPLPGSAGDNPFSWNWLSEALHGFAGWTPENQSETAELCIKILINHQPLLNAVTVASCWKIRIWWQGWVQTW